MYLLLVETIVDSMDLVMFPLIGPNREVWFHSKWYGDMMQLTGYDVFKLCPMNQIWPYCLYCQKFYCPMPQEGASSHRVSKKHQKAQGRLGYLGREVARIEMMQWASWRCVKCEC